MSEPESEKAACTERSYTFHYSLLNTIGEGWNVDREIDGKFLLVAYFYTIIDRW